MKVDQGTNCRQNHGLIMLKRVRWVTDVMAAVSGAAAFDDNLRRRSWISLNEFWTVFFLRKKIFFFDCFPLGELLHP